MKFFRYIGAIDIRMGERLPWWCGACWYSHARISWVCCPIPLNIVVRIGYLLWLWASNPFHDSMQEKIREANTDRVRKGAGE